MERLRLERPFPFPAPAHPALSRWSWPSLLGILPGPATGLFALKIDYRLFLTASVNRIMVISP